MSTTPRFSVLMPMIPYDQRKKLSFSCFVYVCVCVTLVNYAGVHFTLSASWESPNLVGGHSIIVRNIYFYRIGNQFYAKFKTIFELFTIVVRAPKNDLDVLW